MTEVISIESTPNKLEGTINLPSSKSLSNRALILQALSNGNFSIKNLSDADDTRLMQKLIESQDTTLDCQNAGTTLRFLTAYFAMTGEKKTLTGKNRMKNRPIGPLVDALNQLGAKIQYLEEQGYPPIEIKGKPLKGGQVKLDASESSQFITALLLIAPFTQKGIHLVFSGIPVSRPYFNMTIKMLEYFNVKVRQKSNEVAVFPKAQITDKPLTIEPDWTSASYWFGLACIFPGSNLVFSGLSKNSWQGDRAIISLLSRFGLSFNFEKREGLLVESESFYPSEFEALMTDHPDLVPTLATLCRALQIPFSFKGLAHLKHKETDRLKALSKELQKTGAKMNSTDTELSCYEFDPVPASSQVLETYNDHRLAMSWPILAALNKQLKIAEPEVVDKSYPGFWKQLNQMGFNCQ